MWMPTYATRKRRIVVTVSRSIFWRHRRRRSATAKRVHLLRSPGFTILTFGPVCILTGPNLRNVVGLEWRR